MSGSIFGGPIRRLQRFLKHVRALIRQETVAPHKPVRHLRLMQLEDRRVLNASLAMGAGVELTGGEDLLVQDGGMEDVGGGAVQTVDLEISDGTWTVDTDIDTHLYDISADGKTLTVDQTLIDDGGAALDANDALLIQGSDAATDTLVVDLMDLDFVPSGGIKFSGGEDPGNTDNDSLEIKGYELTTEDGVADVTVTHTGAESGSVELAGIGTIAFDEIEPLTLSGDAADLVIQLPAGADNDVVLSDDAGPGNGVSQIASPTNGAFESTTFFNPTNSLTIVDGSGAKTISVEGLDSLYNADLTIDADSDDTVWFKTNDLDLDDGDLTVDAGQIDIQSAVTTSGGIDLTAANSITQTSGTLTADTITLNAGTGIGSASAIQTAADTVTFSNTTSGDVRITDADDVLFSGNNASDGSLIDLQTLSGTLTADNVTQTNGNISLTANGADNEVAVNATRSVNSGNGDITVTADRVNLAGNLTTATGHIVIAPVTAGESIGIGGGSGDLNLDDGEISRLSTQGSITIGDVAAGTGAVDIDSSTFSNNVTIVGGSISVTELSAIGKTVVLHARTGSITDGGDASADITSLSLELKAAMGIGALDALDTRVANLAFNNDDGTTGTGTDVNISNAGTLMIADLTSIGGTLSSSESDGGGTISAAGPFSINTAMSFGGDFTLETNGSGTGADHLTINSNVTHTGSAGAAKTITLRADDDVHFRAGTVSFANVNATDMVTATSINGAITDTFLLEAAAIVAPNVALRAATGIGSGAAGDDDDIDLEVSNVAFQNTTSGVVNLQNNGDLTIGTVDGLTSSTAAGGGSVTANSPLTISHAVTVGASMSFIAGDDNTTNNDDLTIAAAVLLDSTTDSTLTFQAGDDVIIQTAGSVTTSDSVNDAAAHTIVITADNEGAGGTDTDRGSLTQQSATTTISRTTGTVTLTIDAADGVGDSSGDADTTADNALRTTVDVLDVDNTLDNDIAIIESDAVVVNRIVQSGADDDVILTAGGTITVAAGPFGISAVAGTVTLSASGAASDVELESSISTDGGDVIINAGDDVTSSLAGTVIDTRRSAANVVPGAVTITAANGTVGDRPGSLPDGIDFAGTIDASATPLSGFGVPGGNVTLSATSGGGVVQVGSVIATGGRSAVLPIPGGPGGTVDIDAADTVTVGTILANGGPGNASSGGTVTVDAGGAIDLGDVNVSGNSAATPFTASLDGGDGGSVTVNSTTGSVAVTNVIANAGQGDDATDGGDGGTISLTSGGTGDVTIRGTISTVAGVGGGSGGTNGTDGTVRITSAGAIVDGSVVETANIVAGAAALQAQTGVGDDAVSADINTQSGTNGTFTLAGVTESGDINVRNTGPFIIGTVDGLAGVTITDGAANDTGLDNITLVTASPVIIINDVVNNDGGDITIAAEGTTVFDDLDTTADITATGGNGNISLFAGDTISLGFGTFVQASGTGAVSAQAGINFNGGTPVAGNAAAALSSLAVVQSEDGDISFSAPGDVTLNVVNADSNADATRGNVMITADSNSSGNGRIQELFPADGAGNLNIVGNTVTLSAATGIGNGTGVLGEAADIDIDAVTLNATNTTSGAIQLFELDSVGIGVVDNGNRTIVLDAGGSMFDAANNDDTVIDVTGGTVILNAASGIGEDVANPGETRALELTTTSITAATTDGAIDLNSINASNVTVMALTTGNTVSANDPDEITFNQLGGGDVTFAGDILSGGSPAPATDGGNITLTSTAGLTVAASSTVSSSTGAGGTLSVSGAAINGTVTAGSGDVMIQGGGLDTIIAADLTGNSDVAVTALRDVIIQALVTATTGDITVTADSDGIVNSDAFGTALGGVVIESGGQIDGPADVTVTGSDLLNLGANAATVESVQIDADAVAGTSQVIAIGSILLQSGDTAPAAADIIINGRVESTSASTASATAPIRVVAADDVRFNTTGAAATNDGRLVAPGLVGLTATSGGIIDDDAAVETALINAGDLSLRAATGIGHANDIDVDATNLGFVNTTSNNVSITDLSAGLTINSVDGLMTSSNVTGAITLVTASPVTFAVNMAAAGNILIQALESVATNFDNITVNASVTVESTGGDVTFEAGDRIVINDMAVVTASGAGGDVIFDSGFADTDGDGSMTLNGTLAANGTDGFVRLDLNGEGAATQGVDGAITGNGLQLISTSATGTFDLDQSAKNDVQTIAADTDGVIAFRNSTTLEVGTVNGTVGITTSNDDVTLCATSIVLAAGVALGNGGFATLPMAGTLRLSASTGSISQTAGTVVASSLGARAATGITMTMINNNILTFAASGGTGDVSFVESNGFTMGTVTTSDCFTEVIGVTTDDGSIILTTDAGDLTNFDNVTAGGSGDVTLTTTTGGNVILTGTTTADGNTVTVNSAEMINGGGLVTANTVDLNAVAGIGTTPVNALQLAASNIAADTNNGNVDINNSLATDVTVSSLETRTGNITFDQSGGGNVSFTNVATTTTGSITLTSDSSNLTVGTAVTAGGTGDVELTTTTSGDVILTGVVTADGNTATINASDTINGAGVVTADTVDLDAVSGIGNTTAVQLTAATSISADTTSGDIDVDHAATMATTVSSLATSGAGGAINFDQTGNQLLTLTSVSTIDGDITVTNAGGTNASILIGDIDADLTDDVVSITAAGSINDEAANPDTTTDITAAIVDLNAATGIGNLAHVDLAAQNISADTTTGDIILSNDSAADVTVSSLTTGAGSVIFNQIGGGNVSFGVVMATSFEHCLAAGNIILTDTITATDVRLQADAGSINQTGGSIAATNLGARATTGITLSQAANDADNFAASTATGGVSFVDTDGFTVGMVTAGTCFTATTGVATTTDGSVSLTASTDDLINTNGVTATGTGDIILQAITGNITLNAPGGTTTAVGDMITMTAGAAINGAGAITADNVDLNAMNGIGNTTAVQLADVTTLAADTTSGNIDIDQVASTELVVTSMTTGGGTIDFDQTGNQSLVLTNVDSTAGDITITNVGGTTADIALGEVSADVATDTVTVTSTGAISDGSAGDTTSNITALNAALTAAEGIGTDAEDIDTTLVTVAAITDLGDINLTDTNSLAIGTVGVVTGVTISDTADSNSTGDNIAVNATGTLIVFDTITNNDGGNVILSAQTGGVDFADLLILADVSVTGGDTDVDTDGNIALTADEFLVIDANITNTDGGIITGAAGGPIFVDPGNTVSGEDGGITLTANLLGTFAGDFNGITVEDATIRSTTGNISLNGTGGDDGFANDGIDLETATIETTTGNIELTGQGGTSAVATDDNNDGVTVTDMSVIRSTAGGNIMIDGTGGTGPNAEGVEFESSRLTTTTGNVLITGVGGMNGDDNSGIDFDNDTIIESTETGTISVMGTGGAVGARNSGVQIQDDSIVRSVDGNVMIAGIGGADGDLNAGILVANGGIVRSTGSATLTLNGTGGADGTDTAGVVLVGTDSKVESTTGNISITGNGGAAGADFTEGVLVLDDSVVESLGTATITVLGNAGGTGSNAVGVVVDGADSAIRSVDGTITVTGTGAGGAAGINNEGVLISSGGEISTSGAAAIDIDGDGMMGTGTGVLITGAGSSVSANTGTLDIEGTSTGSDGVEISDSATVTSVDGNITISGTEGAGDAISLRAAATVSGTGNAMITLNGTGSIFMQDGTSVTAANAQRIDAAATDDITISLLSTPGGEVRVDSTNGAIIDADAGTDNDITALSAALQAAAGIGGSGTAGAIETQLTNLAFDNSGTGFVNIINAGNLTLSNVNGVASSENADGNVKLTNTGDLTLDEDIILVNGDLFLAVTGNVSQNAGNDITASGLGLMVDGTTVLDNAGNNVVTLAAENMGPTTYRDADVLTIDMVTVDGMEVTGVFTTNDDITINVLAGDLNIVQAINTRGGNVLINAVAADINSTASGTITTAGTMANQDSGTIQLTANQNVSLQGNIDSSGFGNDTGMVNSNGGDVLVRATDGNVAVDNINTSGGDVLSGVGGNAGMITLDAGPMMTVTFNDNPSVDDPEGIDINSAGGRTAGSDRTGNGADLILTDAVIVAASDADGQTQTINTSGATAGDVTFQSTVDGATGSVNDLTIDARDTDAEDLANPASGNVTFVMDVGATTRLGDLTISDAKNFTADQLIRATSLTQTAGIGNTTLNEVNIQTVTTGPTSGVAITTDYTINLRGNVSVSDSTMLVDNTAATGETITINSVDGNIIMEDGVIVSTDEDPAAGQSSEFTGDVLAISADTAGVARRAYVAAERDSDADGTADDVDTDLDGDGTLDADPADTDVPAQGLFKAGPNTELRTDGGVAKRFIPLIDPDGLISPTITNSTADQVNFRTEWEVEIGVQGEENLRVNVDWRDPNDDPTMFADSSTGNPVNSNRQQTFLVRDEAGGANPPVEAIAHEYNILDFVDFINAEITSFPADFSVSHHESIVVNGSQLDQGPLSGPESIPGGVITTTDNPNTGTGVADPGTDVTDPVDSNSDLNFETGLFEVIIPTNIGFVPQVEPERPAPNPEPAVAPPVAAQTLVQFVPNDLADFPTSSYSSQSEDYFQLRQNSTEAVEGFEHIDSDIGWKLLQPRRLKEWVYSNDLDGRGYELWLITTKVKDGRNITFERPVLKFDVFDNQPFPMEEEILDELPEMKLVPLELDENGNPEADSVPNGEQPEVEAVEPDETISQGVDPTGGEYTRAVLTGLAVSTVMRRTHRRRPNRQHVSTVSRILDRIPR